MLSDLNLKIKNVGPINEADIDIGKINVIGGPNATGKSTASRLLYCFLKGGIINRQAFAYSLIERDIYRIIVSADRGNHVVEINRENLLEQYEGAKEIILNSDESNFSKRSISDIINRIDKQIEIIEKNDNELYESLLKTLLSSEFHFEIEGHAYLKGIFNDDDFCCSLENKDSSSSGFFIISNIFYIDSLSIFDLSYRHNERNSYLRKSISSVKSIEFLDDQINSKIIEVEEKINDLLQGKFGHSRMGGFAFIGNDGHECPIENISSGMKQIGVIQRLLANRKLKENSFLIIDEPEVNLHPGWQVKLAEVLTILAKDLNVYIYINTHSPMFIEAMEVFSDYYDLKDDTYYYLTENSTSSFGYKFRYVGVDELYELFNQLSKPYRYVESYRIKSKRKRKNID